MIDGNHEIGFISISDICKNPSSIFEELSKTKKRLIVFRNNKPIGAITSVNNIKLSGEIKNVK